VDVNVGNKTIHYVVAPPGGIFGLKVKWIQAGKKRLSKKEAKEHKATENYPVIGGFMFVDGHEIGRAFRLVKPNTEKIYEEYYLALDGSRRCPFKFALINSSNSTSLDNNQVGTVKWEFFEAALKEKHSPSSRIRPPFSPGSPSSRSGTSPSFNSNSSNQTQTQNPNPKPNPNSNSRHTNSDMSTSLTTELGDSREFNADKKVQHFVKLNTFATITLNYDTKEAIDALGEPVSNETDTSDDTTSQKTTSQRTSKKRRVSSVLTPSRSPTTLTSKGRSIVSPKRFMHEYANAYAYVQKKSNQQKRQKQ